MALVQAEAAKEAALRAAQPARPAFALGFLPGAEIGLLPEVTRVLRDEFPDIEIHLSSDYSPALAKALMRRKLDAAFMRSEEAHGRFGLQARALRPADFLVSERPSPGVASSRRASRGHQRNFLPSVQSCNLPQQQLGATDANRVASQLKQHRDPYCLRRLADVDVLANFRFAPRAVRH
jgi:DNA-binding transcriptional LysR family regulator